MNRILWQVLPQPGLFGWKLVRNGKFVCSYLTQSRAIKAARRWQQMEWECYTWPSELQIHNAQGEIRDKDTFPRASDPVESKG